MDRAAVPCRCRFPAFEMSRRFYLSEAESLLPQVSAWIQEAVLLKSECQEAENKIEALSQKVMLYGGMIVDRERAQAVRQRRDNSLEQLKATVEKIHETGCVVKDLDKGLVDFPTLFVAKKCIYAGRWTSPRSSFGTGCKKVSRAGSRSTRNFGIIIAAIR
jgi:hypothetical protein